MKKYAACFKTVIWILFSYYIWYWYFILRRNQCDHTCTSIVKFCELAKQKKMAIFPIVSAVFIFFIEFTIRFYYNLQQLINLYVWCMLVYVISDIWMSSYWNMHILWLEDWNNYCFILTVSQSYFTDERI